MWRRVVKFFLFWQFQLLIFPWRNVSKQTPQRKLCEELLKHLSAKQFRQYRTSAALATTLPVRYNNIEIYTEKLKQAVKLIREKEAIPPDWLATSETPMSLDRFLISRDGYYLDVEQAVAKFRAAGLELCRVLQDSDTVQYGLPEHNLRILTKLFVNLRLLTRAMIEASLSY